jgi:hypothetical protein
LDAKDDGHYEESEGKKTDNHSSFAPYGLKPFAELFKKGEKEILAKLLSDAP